MTKKYEKFEEWMVGKKFYNVYDPDDIGVIVGKSEDEGDVDVIYENDGPCWAMICNVNFVDSAEEKPSEEVGAQESSQIDWEVGQVVWDTSLGQGRVIHVFDTQIQVKFGNSQSWNIIRYTPEGIYQMIQCAKNRTLFFSEPTITADTMPPKKPFTPILKEGDEVVTWFEDGSKYFTVVREETLTAVIDDNGDSFLKSETRFLKIGEEIKWEN